jgi:hypothetical protein
MIRMFAGSSSMNHGKCKSIFWHIATLAYDDIIFFSKSLTLFL